MFEQGNDLHINSPVGGDILVNGASLKGVVHAFEDAATCDCGTRVAALAKSTSAIEGTLATLAADMQEIRVRLSKTTTATSTTATSTTTTSTTTTRTATTTTSATTTTTVTRTTTVTTVTTVTTTTVESATFTSNAEVTTVKNWIANGFSAFKNKPVTLVRCYSMKDAGDGGTADGFHKACDGKGPTVTVIKTKNGFRFGGVTDHSWTSNCKATSCYTASDAAFLFCLNCYGAKAAGKPAIHQLKCSTKPIAHFTR